ncbi:MAG: TonB-dependent receptor, partial [Myxococcales bacterium]|nr:TonB-dependent receptor [Myxococcales bacterium]
PAEPAPPSSDLSPDLSPDLSDEQLAAAAAAQAGNEASEVIVVTGSTIERRALTTPAPVSIVSKAALEAAGLSTVGGILQNLPSQANGINAQENNGGDGSTRIYLRGLGAARTLTLINGRRVVPGGVGADASVDLNAIPLAMIERVEVLKDGASAVYGSDAIGGVVNIITRTDLNGSEAAIYTGASQRGDGLSYDMSFATGISNRKGNLLVSAGYQHQRPVFAGDRAFSRTDETYDYGKRTEGVGGSVTTPQGRINTDGIDADGDGRGDGGYDLCGADDGTPIQFCTLDGSGGYRPFSSASDLYNFQPDNYLYTPSARYHIYSLGGYQLHPRVRGFFEASHLNRTSSQRLAPDTFVDTAPISAQSLHNPLGVDILGYRRRLSEFGPRRSLQGVETFRAVVGFDGKLPDDLHNWKWEVSYNFGRTDAVQRLEGNLSVSRLANALGPSFLDPTNAGAPTCGTVDAPIAGCVPLNLLAGADANAITPDMIDYVTFTGVSTGFNQQQTLLATTSGQLTRTPWGGDISMAIGVDHRREAGGSTPDPLSASGDSTGNATRPTNGRYRVSEGFVELSAVPVIGKGFAQWVELDAAARVFDYDNFGSGITWKAGGLFRTLGGLAVRGTYSTAFRAPSISELYAGKQDSSPLADDPCDTTPASADDPITLDPVVAQQCAKQGVPADASFGNSQLRSVVGGNAALEAETATVRTLGVVFEPPMVKGLSVTVDYFHIAIEKAIQSLGANVILSNCFRRELDEYCKQVFRNPALGYKIDFVDDPISNVGGTRTSGVDGAIAYDHSHAYGRFRHQLEATYLIKYKLNNTLQILDGRKVYDFGVFPPIKANVTSSWGYRGVGAGFNVRYVAGYDECNNNDCNSYASGPVRADNSRKIGSSVNADVFGSYTFKTAAGTTSIAVGINNVTDAEPPTIYSGLADSDPATYDYMGRFFYTRASQQF